MELTAEVIKQYHLDILKCATLEEKQNMFLSQVRNNKDFAILQHRKMWIWIAQQYAKGSKVEVRILKKQYIKEKCFNVYMHSNCFCCEYASYEMGLCKCVCCPLSWVDEFCLNTDSSEYNLILDCYFNYAEMSHDISKYLASNNFILNKYYAMLRKETKLKHKVVKLAYKISQLPERKERSNED